MKTRSLIISFWIISFLFISSLALAQNDQPNDEAIMKDVVGTWQHVTSTDPKGNVLRFDRELELNANGSGICTRYEAADTLQLPFEWDVKNGAIQLYVYNKRGKRINTDAQHVSLVDAKSLYLDTVYASADQGKVSLYRRKSAEVAKY